jgi:hypothetical protein
MPIDMEKLALIFSQDESPAEFLRALEDLHKGLIVLMINRG